MKIRNGYVSNSSSSSFVVIKYSLTNEQKDMIYNYQDYADFFKTIDDTCIDKFEYCDTDPWRIVDYNDFIFGETSMDNFSMQDFLDYIKVNPDSIDWNDGYNDEPYQSQLDFVNKLKSKYRKKKLVELKYKK